MIEKIVDEKKESVPDDMAHTISSEALNKVHESYNKSVESSIKSISEYKFKNDDEEKAYVEAWDFAQRVYELNKANQEKYNKNK